MFVRHKALNIPPNTRQYLWRYFPYERLLDLLNTEELFFTHLPAFSDALEGSLSQRSKNHLVTWFAAQNKSSMALALAEVKKYEEAQTEFNASCWHMNDFESYLMWKAYAGRGYAVRTTFERVQASFDDFDGVITGGVIDYLDFARERAPIGNVFHLVMTKDRPYSDEREFRLLLWNLDPKNQSVNSVKSGVRVPVSIRHLIERVFVNPTNTTVPGELLDLLEQRKIPLDESTVKYRKSRSHST